MLFGIWLASAAARLPRDESGPLAELATELLTSSEPSLRAEDPERISASESMSREMVDTVGPRAANVIVRDRVKGVEVLQERQPHQQEMLRRVLAVVQGWEAMLQRDSAIPLTSIDGMQDTRGQGEGWRMAICCRF